MGLKFERSNDLDKRYKVCKDGPVFPAEEVFFYE